MRRPRHLLPFWGLGPNPIVWAKFCRQRVRRFWTHRGYYLHKLFRLPPEHQPIEILISAAGQDIIRCDSDHLYYVAKWGGCQDSEGWTDLMRPTFAEGWAFGVPTGPVRIAIRTLQEGAR